MRAGAPSHARQQQQQEHPQEDPFRFNCPFVVPHIRESNHHLATLQTAGPFVLAPRGFGRRMLERVPRFPQVGLL